MILRGRSWGSGRQEFGLDREKIFRISFLRLGKTLITRYPANVGLGALPFSQGRRRQGLRPGCKVIEAVVYHNMGIIGHNPELRSGFVAGPVRIRAKRPLEKAALRGQVSGLAGMCANGLVRTANRPQRRRGELS